MEFGILFTSHSNVDVEPYPHRDVHARVTREILRADELGFDYAWVAEHHFSNQYGIMPDVFVYAGYLAALTKRIRIGTAVVTLPLANPLRVAENAAFIDILSNGRFTLGLGSGYRQYEFDGFGVDFEARRDIQEEALPLLMDMLRSKRVDHRGKHFRVKVDDEYELFPHALQEPHPPVFLDAVRGAGQASEAIPRRARGDARFLARQPVARPCRHRPLGLCRRDRRQGARRERGRHPAPPEPFRQRPHFGLSRHGGERRRQRARLRHARARHHPARLAGDGGREGPAPARHDRRRLDHAALPALVRRRARACLARALCRGGHAEIQGAGAAGGEGARMMDKIEPFDLFAIRYAHHAKRSSAENFINGDPHEDASPLDYFVWVAQRSDRVFVIDTGFGEEAARQRQRQLLRRPADGVKALGLAPEQIEDVIITHLHYDHAGTLDAFPRARFHIQDREMAFATGRCMCHAAMRHAFA